MLIIQNICSLEIISIRFKNVRQVIGNDYYRALQDTPSPETLRLIFLKIILKELN